MGSGGGEPRIPPVPADQWPSEMGEVVGALRPPNPRHPFPPREPGRPKGLNALGTFAHHPELTRAFHTFNGHILFGTTLTTRQRELLVLRVATLRQCEYEWVQHLVLAGDAGLTDDEVARAAEGPGAEGWDPVEAALLQAADDLIADGRVGDAAWSVLAGALDRQQLMDAVFTVAAYDAVAMAFLSFGVQVDDDLAEWRKRHSPN